MEGFIEDGWIGGRPVGNGFRDHTYMIDFPRSLAGSVLLALCRRPAWSHNSDRTQCNVTRFFNCQADPTRGTERRWLGAAFPIGTEFSLWCGAASYQDLAKIRQHQSSSANTLNVQCEVKVHTINRTHVAAAWIKTQGTCLHKHNRIQEQSFTSLAKFRCPGFTMLGLSTIADMSGRGVASLSQSGVAVPLRGAAEHI